MTSQPSSSSIRIVPFFKTIIRGLSSRNAEPPKGIEPINDFDAERYLGRWYEIKRLDHNFERGATNVFAEYSLRDDGKIKVVNNAYNPKSGNWGSIEGYAQFRTDPSIASLAVTFFWPITAGYHVIELDREGYQWAMVTASSRDYLWLLARQPSLDQATLKRLISRAEELGYAVENLISVDHSKTQQK
jgi:apolipoprotein D and lipocalin family protein